MSDGNKNSTELRRLNATFLEAAIHLGFVAFLVYWAFVIVVPFIPIIVWSVVLAVAVHPTFDWLKAALGGRGRLAATLITLVGLMIVLGPATWLAIGLLDGSKMLIHRVESGELIIPPAPMAVRNWPLIGQSLYDFWESAFTNTRGVLEHVLPQLKPAGEMLLQTMGSAGAGTFKFLVSVIIMGFLLSAGPGLFAATNRLARRIDPGYGERFVELSGATILAVSRGVIGISALQAVIGGFGMWLAGVPFASLLTLAILVLGILQLGPVLIAIPVVIWGWMTASTLTAIGLTICMVTIYLVEALMKPFVLAHGLTTPTIVIFVGVIGGILAHGVPGLFVGPIVLSVAWEFARAWIYQGPAAEATVYMRDRGRTGLLRPSDT
jgi:predicted PurR-regulated permease PerM